MAQEDVNSLEEYFELMGKIAFFKNFSTYEKKRVAGNEASFGRYQAGQRLIKEGDNDTSFFILLSGTVTIVKKGTPIINLGEGEFFGEMAFLTNEERQTSVLAAEDGVIALQVDQSLMLKLSADIREKIKDQIINKLVERLAKTTDRLRARM